MGVYIIIVLLIHNILYTTTLYYMYIYIILVYTLYNNIYYNNIYNNIIYIYYYSNNILYAINTLLLLHNSVATRLRGVGGLVLYCTNP